jgi:hypothetical protein
MSGGQVPLQKLLLLAT